MAKTHSKAESKISKAQRRYKVGYVSKRHQDPKTLHSRYYSRHPSLHLKGDWLKEAGFDTGRGVTVRISPGCLSIIADNNEVYELRKQLLQALQVVKEVKAVLV
ncbi:SymE family type I addiction module toxin [Enterobacter sp. Bisph1]|uniref:SymE family type I addiction module toxin n=1 Tax=Enterobacter sp. Bisph1 TaxID=1274399 RepID=UPI00057C0479|nr:SymE family type I addiction module toxin [Enterobacter sp. Bisph1]